LLTWHPLYSSVAAAFRADLSGRIVYRDAQKVDTQSTAARMLEQQRLRNQQQRRGLNFGELFLQRSDLSKSNPVNRNAHVVHCRSGDVIPCRVDAMDESGVLVSTADSGRGLIPHEKIKAVEFVSNSPPPSIDQAKRERLLTIPRLQKSDPPTHLLCSHNGDFLRCNVIRTENDQLRVQVQSEETLIPRNRIAQIIWFHRDEYDSELPSESEPLDQQTRDQASNNESSDEYRGLVQAVLADGKRATFTPATVVDGFIDGVSPWVGQCRFDLGSVDQLLIGSLIKEDVVEFAYNQWKLRRAVEPLVTAAMQGDQPGSGGAQSPLVGMPAPELSLLLLDGTEFDLAGNQGQIIVLGFWASWSAPSMELLPQVIEAVGEFDSGLVRLVTVNLQESAEQVRTALTRQQLQPLVALDRDGVAAERFQATVVPQLVIVGADGVVKGLHIGGGPEVMPRLKEQIAQLLDSTIPSPP
jgi:thiol-disulfide isomerase/thioredoxin